MARTNRQWIYIKKPEGNVTPDIFAPRETEIAEPRAGEVLVKATLPRSRQPRLDGWAYIPRYARTRRRHGRLGIGRGRGV